MARVFLTAINLAKNELQNAAVHNLAAAPSGPVKGQLYFDTVGNVLYWWNGTQWVAAQGGAGAVPGDTATTQAIGDAPVGGASALYSRADHKHGMPAFGLVTAETVFGGASSSGASTNIARSDHTHGNPTHDAAAHSTIPINSLAGATGPIDMNGFVIGEVGTPVATTDAANKGYVDNAIAGLSWKDPVRLASTASMALTGVGLPIDGVMPAVGDRILVKDQTTAQDNGIYVAASGAWTRATDADSEADLLAAAVFVTEGTTNGDSAWVLTANAPITINTTLLPWAKFAGGATVTDGDKGDIIVSGGGANWQIDALAVGTAELADLSVTNGKIANDAVNVLKILNDSVDNTKLSDMPNNTFKGRTAGSTGDPQDVSAATMVAILSSSGLARKYQTNVAAGTSSLVSHNFNTNYVSVEVFRMSAPFDTIDCDVERTTPNAVTVRFATAVAAGEFGVVIFG